MYSKRPSTGKAHTAGERRCTLEAHIRLAQKKDAPFERGVFFFELHQPFHTVCVGWAFEITLATPEGRTRRASTLFGSGLCGLDGGIGHGREVGFGHVGCLFGGLAHAFVSVVGSGNC
jgi:hypothetical protein